MTVFGSKVLKAYVILMRSGAVPWWGVGGEGGTGAPPPPPPPPDDFFFFFSFFLFFLSFFLFFHIFFKTFFFSFIFFLIHFLTFFLLSLPNEVSEGTMKRAPYVCVSVRASVHACVRPGVRAQNQ